MESKKEHACRHDHEGEECHCRHDHEGEECHCHHDHGEVADENDIEADFHAHAAKLNDQSRVRKAIAVISGKGGVGKSLVTSLLAVLAQRAGLKAAILDADITGPSIPTAFGLHGNVESDERYVHPVVTRSGIPVVSLNLFLDDATEPVVWHGSMLADTVAQFWSEVVWGDVDLMFIDMPPGTGDIPMAVFQSIPIRGAVVVASPQELVGLIVEKALKMAEMHDIPVLGLVENMSYYKCPKCGDEHPLFGESHADDIARRYNIQTVCRLPVDPAFAKAVDAGDVESVDCPALVPMLDALARGRAKTSGRVAVALEDGRIAPHFGKAKQFKIYEIERGEVASASLADVGGDGCGPRVDFLREHKVGTVVCGHLGQGATASLSASQVEFYGDIEGDPDAAVRDFIAGTLPFHPDAALDHAHAH